MSQLKRRLATMALVVSSALLLVPAAGQASQVFGSGFVHDPTQTACEMLGPCSVFGFHEIPGEGQNSTAGSPIDGVITKFRIAAKVESPTQVTFRVGTVTPTASADSATAVATGTGPTVTLRRTIEEEQLPPERTPIQEFPARVKVKKGQHLGLDAPSSLEVSYDSSGSKFSYEYAPPLVDGASERNSNNALGELLVQASVEPDADGDGFGDETQDGCPTQKGTHGACDLTKPTVTGFRVKRGKISYRLSEPATVRIALARRTRRHFKQVGRKFTGPGNEGANKVGVPHARNLAPGSYRVTVTATDAAGNKTTKSVGFVLR